MSESSPSKPPVKRRGAPVVERVLEVALAELAAVGFHRLSLPVVAERAGVNKTSLYRRWPTKEALIGAALRGAMGHTDPLPDTGALRSDMLAFARHAADWAESPVGRAVMLSLWIDGEDPEVRALVEGIAGGAVAGPVAIFERAQARGELPAGADVSMALTVIAGAMSHRIFVENQSLDGDFLPRLVGLVVDGLVNGSGGRG